MATVTALCGRKMTMNEFARHIPRCPRCASWWGRRRAEIEAVKQREEKS